MKTLSDITAFILCGGLGTRLRAVVSDCPKSMAPIGSRPFLEIQLRQLRAQGIRRVVLGTGYLSEQVEAYFQDGAALDLAVSYSRETEPLGTGGAMRLALDQLSDPVLILNGDSYCECDLAAVARTYFERQSEFVMVTRQVENAGRYGRVQVMPGEKLAGFEEKRDDGLPGLINSGIYLCSRGILETIPPGRPVSFEKETVPAMLARPCHVFETSGMFIDIGIPEDYSRAQLLLAAL